MKLYRYEVTRGIQSINLRDNTISEVVEKTDGIFHSQIHFKVYVDNEDKKLVKKYKSKLYLEYETLSKELHSPDSKDFLIEGATPDSALFYFTQEGYNMFKDLFKKFSDCCESGRLYNLYCDPQFLKYAKVKLTEIDLRDIKKYKCWYQDNLQMCLEIL